MNDQNSLHELQLIINRIIMLLDQKNREIQFKDNAIIALSKELNSYGRVGLNVIEGNTFITMSINKTDICVVVRDTVDRNVYFFTRKTLDEDEERNPNVLDDVDH